VPEPTSFEAEIATEKVKRCQSPGTDKVLAGMFPTDNMLCSEIHTLINYTLNIEEMPKQWKE
jgi:hypothetical protein